MNAPSLITPYLLAILDAPLQIYTARIVLTNCSVSSIISHFKSTKEYLTYIIAKEISSKQVSHLHIRFSKALQEGQVRKDIKKALPKLHGNGSYQLKKIKQKVDGNLEIVYLNDDKLVDCASVWKSATYICKDNEILSYRGYTPDDIAILIKIGASLKCPKSPANTRKPMYLQIISHYDITETDLLNLPELTTNIVSYYYLTLHKYPNKQPLFNCLHNICMNLSSRYARTFIESVLNEFEESYSYTNTFCCPLPLFHDDSDDTL